MRIPTHNVCRAFPELDSFSDEQCQRFLDAILQRHWLSRLGLNVMTVVLFVVGGFGLMRAVVAVLQSFNRPSDPNAGITLVLLAVIVGTFVGGMSGLLIRDRWLRRRLAARILELVCAGCGYSLLGLAATDGKIICPECGNPCELSSRGIAVDAALVSQPSELRGTP